MFFRKKYLYLLLTTSGISKQPVWTLKHYARIYNLISVPQIARFLLGVAIISSNARVVEARSRR